MCTKTHQSTYGKVETGEGRNHRVDAVECVREGRFVTGEAVGQEVMLSQLDRLERFV